jgi:Kelch motif
MRHFVAAVMLMGCGTDACKQGTLFLSYALPDSAVGADQIRVTLTVGKNQPQSMTASRRGQGSSGSIEIDFGGGYPADQPVTVAMSALGGSETLASGMRSLTLKHGCTALSLSLAAASDSDLGIFDASEADLSDGATTPLCAPDAGSDVDCGGSCPPCGLDKRCRVDGDCTTHNCSGGFCTPVSGPPSWVPLAAPLAPGRQYISSTTDLAGRVYAVAGGSTSNVQCWDPSKSQWIPLASTTNYAYGLATDRNGILHMTGGASTNVIATVQTYDPSMDKWSSSVSMPGPLYFHGSVTGPDGRIYTLGGASADNGAGVVATFQAFDVMTNMWSPQQSLPGPLVNMGATVANGLIYAVAGDSGATANATAHVLVYSPQTNAWTNVAPLPLGPRTQLSAVTAPDGRIYAIGGVSAQGTAQTIVEAYHPATDRWVKVASLGTARAFFGAAVGGDGRIYALGGSNSTSSGLGSVEVYGPTVSPSPSSVAAGAQVTLTGSNFAAGATVSVWLDQASGPPLVSATTDSNGALSSSIQITVPAATSGKHSLVAVDDLSQYPATAPLTIQ